MLHHRAECIEVLKLILKLLVKCPLKEAGLSRCLVSKAVFLEVLINRVSLVAQMVKNLPAVLGTWV